MKNTLILLSFALVFANGCKTEVQYASNDFESRVDSVFAEYNDIVKPGAAVAVVMNGEIVFQKGYGSANLEYDIPVTSSTIFHIASVSKQFTVFSILLLVEEGKLDFDDDIRKYIPEVPDFGKTISLRHLASHTSGLRDQWNLLAMAGWRQDDVITKEHVLKLVAKQKELNFEPGEAYTYCNTGFTLLAEVVSRVSGQSFAEFTKSRIFDPLQMTNTLFYDDHEKIVKNRAYSYHSDDLGFKKSVLSYANVGATSLFTTVEDLSLWAMNFGSPKVGNNEIINQLNTLATLNNGETFGGAHGQFVNKYRGLNQIQHGGADAGYRSYLGRFPDQNFAVSVFSNFASANTRGLAMRITDIFLEDALISESENKVEAAKYEKLSNEELEAFAGSYWNEAGSYSRKVFLKNDTLRYSRGEGNESLIVPIGNNIFDMLSVGVDSKVGFEIEKEQKTIIVTIDDGDTIISKSYIPINYSKEQLQEFAGTFYSEELSTSYSFKIKNDTLTATHSRLNDIRINPIKKDMFFGDQWFFNNIKFERDNSNAISGIRISNGRVKNLLFKKTAHNMR
ncbi:serine hydrolase domain-containing protein [uncultured Kriegella sp.]|uniref:serine hydrolase domain-containing protein n=1 Tax=uncultured Kriegella sp. TaxID=1798910 RepID=UPI0030D74192|tara:strand:+ start:1952 stop:3643 length:1692 start_codon:yes stop_codon:yes gene_type:complete